MAVPRGHVAGVHVPFQVWANVITCFQVRAKILHPHVGLPTIQPLTGQIGCFHFFSLSKENGDVSYIM
jgi:hypothetical protein